MLTSNGPLLLKEENYQSKDKDCAYQQAVNLVPALHTEAQVYCTWMYLHVEGTERRSRHSKTRHSRTENSSLLAWKSATKHCGKRQTRTWQNFASKSWHHLRSLQNSAFSQLNDILKLITGFQMTINSCQACPVHKVTCISLIWWVLKPGSTISVNAYSTEKHLMAQHLTNRTCFREIGKQAMTPTNPRLSFSPCHNACDVFLQCQEPHPSLRCSWVAFVSSS